MQININELTIGQLKGIQSMNILNLDNIPNSDGSAIGSPGLKCKPTNIGKVVLVRTYSAGVHFGTLIEKEGTNVLLENANRIHTWEGAFTLSEVAIKGINSSSRVSCNVPLIELTESIEIIPMSDEAIKKALENVE